MSDKRIIEQTGSTEILNDDWFVKDSPTGGTTKIQGSKLFELLGGKIDDVQADEISFVNEDKVADLTPLAMIGTASGDIASLDEGSGLPFKSLVVNIEPQQEGSGDPSPDNIRPISGHTKVDVVVSPLNISQLYNGQIYGDGTWVENNARLTNVQTAQSNVYFLKAGTYTLDFDMLNPSAPTLKQCSLLTKDSNFNIVENFANAWNSLPFTFTLTQDGYLYFTVRRNADTIINPSDYRVKILGQSYNVEFKDGSNPLTVYGGTLDVVSGELVVDRAEVDLGTFDWYYATDNQYPVFYADKSNFPRLPAYTDNEVTVISDRYTVLSNRNFSAFANGTQSIDMSTTITSSGTVQRCLIRDSRYTSASDFKTAMDGVQLVYELQTPQTYQLTPTQVNSLLGVNNIWADTGSIRNAELIKDATTVINSLIARIEALENA